MAAPTVSILLVGIGGYGNTYASALLDAPPDRGVRIAGAVDPHPEGCRALDRLRQADVPIVSDLSEFYARHAADLAVISSPIGLHCEQVCACLANGSHVLCEKPLCATADQITVMQRARDAARRFVAVGYQWSFSPAIQALKADAAAGRFGRARRLRTLVLWPRNAAYYNRNDWAGAVRDSQGRWVLDSPANNAAAHYLHNMFYVLGPSPDRSAFPRTVEAELYRANPIQNFDTCACRVITDDDAEILFYVSHAVPDLRGPEFVYEFEQAEITYRRSDHVIRVRFRDGREVEYGDPDQDGLRKLWTCVDAVRAHAAGGAPFIPCGIDAASSQTLCIDAMHRTAGRSIRTFPPHRIRTKGDGPERITFAEGLAEALSAAWETGLYPTGVAALL